MSKAATQLDTLAAALADPDSDLDQIADLEDELVAARDTGLIPRLQEHLASAVDAGNSYGRHVLCNILAVTAGSKALPELLRAFARDLGDDQDSLSAILTDFAHQDRAYARSIVLPWAAGPRPGPACATSERAMSKVSRTVSTPHRLSTWPAGWTGVTAGRTNGPASCGRPTWGPPSVT